MGVVLSSSMAIRPSVATTVLKVDELKAYVDRGWPEDAPAAPPTAKRLKYRIDEEPEECTPLPPAQSIRLLLARRLFRAGRVTEALPYYPAEVRPAVARETPHRVRVRVLADDADEVHPRAERQPKLEPLSVLEQAADQPPGRERPTSVQPPPSAVKSHHAWKGATGPVPSVSSQ